ncbi:MAG: right-handed parallel beta-helix repeat-containing protein [Anaerolineales bacterium]|nr:right-handed parallel beta-helix repeat-containing protein [Anaerolineales bacterium]
MRNVRISRIGVSLFLLVFLPATAGCLPAPGAIEALEPAGSTTAIATIRIATSFPTAPASAVYYVSPNGDDANPGSEALPWRTIQKAAEMLAPGETVLIIAGTYSERVIPQRSGTAEGFITYAAYPGHTVIIAGTDVEIPEWGGLFEISNQAYIRVSGLTIINAQANPHNPGLLVEHSSQIIVANNTIRSTNDSGIAIWASAQVIVEHNDVGQACLADWNESISIGGSTAFEVRYNHVHDSQKEGIAIKDDSSNGLVYGNEVWSVHSVGIYIDGWDKSTHDVAVFANLVHDIQGNGFALASEQGGLLENIYVYNNIAYDNQWTGLHVTTCCSDSHPMRNLQILNNTFVENGRDPWGGGILLENPQAVEVLIRNNLCSQNLSFQIAVSTSVPAANFIVDHNLIDGYRNGQDEIRGMDFIEADPLFRDRIGRDFHLLAGSPALNHGVSDQAPATDFDGQPRPQGAGLDIGADEGE